ncbi:MAG TPA: MEDS domain-containing protein [Polyangia bacterium]|nr:MEDS domain-containing protein [Polyangia bacterium]
MNSAAPVVPPPGPDGPRPAASRPVEAISGNHHVQFYEQEAFLYDVVAGYLGAGLEADQPLVVIATESHREAFCTALRQDGFDVDEAIKDGRLTLLDARATLATFMVDGKPHWERFRAAIGPVLERCMTGGREPIRAYGEMVDLLCKDGNPEAALQLEGYWNDLGKLYPFVLFCAYAMDGFASDEQRDHFQGVCQAHTHVAPAEDFVGDGDPQALRRQISQLQQRSRALETELGRRRKLEAALRSREEELRDFLENAVEGMHWVGPDGTILWANPAELALLGYPMDEYLGHDIREFHVDRAVVDDMLERLGRRETLRDWQARMRCKDGSVKHVLISSNALFRDGEFVHTRCFTRDVTEQHRLGQELTRQNEQLARTLRFSEMFVGILGHDLRNPVMGISAAAALLLRRFNDEAITKPARRIASSSERMSRMIDHLLDFTRIRLGGGLPLTRRRTDLAQICRAAIEEAEAAETALPMTLSVAGDGSGEWDADRLAQLIGNLVGNAQAHGETAVHLQVHGDRAAEVVLEISNGGTVSPEMLPVIFEPFRSGAERKGERSSGIGLGLFISEQIVLAHAGVIGVTSSPQEGTRFTVRLPRDPRAAAGAFPSLETGERRG